MKKIGLTGNIASGKSEIEKIISNLGYVVVDLDEITHDLFKNNKEVQNEIIKEFNSLDRKIISSIVFNDKNKKETLEKIIHPRLKDYILKLFKEKENEKLIVISGALIYEVGFDKLFDVIIFADTEKEKRLVRLIKRNNLTKEQALLRLKSQNLNNKHKANYIIENNSSLFDLEKKVKEIFQIILSNI